jgi:hypothetical protein
MFLITERVDKLLSESIIDEATGKKDWFINGVFMQAETQNRNGRIYPSRILEREVKRYDNEFIQTSRAIGELNHPQHPNVNPERASHLITELNAEGNNYVGKAKILDTPMGNIVKGLLDGGVNIGVSSRGVGSLKKKKGVNEVQSDYRLLTVDIVSDPSAPDAFVEGIMEGKQWTCGIDGSISECDCEARLQEHQDFINKLVRQRKFDEDAQLKIFDAIINKL